MRRIVPVRASEIELNEANYVRSTLMSRGKSCLSCWPVPSWSRWRLRRHCGWRATACGPRRPQRPASFWRRLGRGLLRGGSQRRRTQAVPGRPGRRLSALLLAQQSAGAARCGAAASGDAEPASVGGRRTPAGDCRRCLPGIGRLPGGLAALPCLAFAGRLRPSPAPGLAEQLATGHRLAHGGDRPDQHGSVAGVRRALAGPGRPAVVAVGPHTIRSKRHPHADQAGCRPAGRRDGRTDQ